ncbi:MAG: membrane integrity-associated transporter subunit PqiC [Alphaproteobacteria bacterium]|nr:membrane integrity-associated transporter subunit PqiC [Alphaproteobacteria bacterium]
MRKTGLVIVFLLGLTACFGGYSPNSNFYRLQPVTATDRVFISKKSIAVGRVGLPEYLSRPQMVMLDEKTPKVEIAEFNRWGENLDNMLQRKTAADLRVYLPKAKIAGSDEEVQNAAYEVRIEVMRMDMMRQGKVVLEAKWYVLNNNGQVVKSGRFEQSQVIKPRYEDYAYGASTLLGKMNMDIARALAEI